MRISDLPAASQFGALLGLRVLDWSDPEVRLHIRRRIWLPEDWTLRYDEMFTANGIQAIIVGELAHFTYRVKQAAENKACRGAAAHHIKTAATRILGEPWELSA